MNIWSHSQLGSGVFHCLCKDFSIADKEEPLQPLIFPTCTKEFLFSSCKKVIYLLRTRILEQEKDKSEKTKSFLDARAYCQYSKRLLEKPMRDNHGHIFEEEEIRPYLQKHNNLCPIDNTQITLTPDNVPLEIIESFLVPRLNETGTAHGANGSLVTAKKHIQAEKYSQALSLFEQICKQTNKSEDYEELPVLLALMKEPLKATLAYLYLAQKQIEEDKSAVESLTKASTFMPEEEQLSALKAYYLRYSGQSVQAGQAFRQIIKKSLQINHDILAYFEQLLACCPTDLQVYNELASLVDDSIKLRIFLVGLVAMSDIDQDCSKMFYQKACNIAPDNPHIHLTRLCRLRKEDPDRKEIYFALAKIFATQREFKKAKHFFKATSDEEQPVETTKKYVKFLLSCKQKEEAEKVSTTYFESLYPDEETGLREMIELFGMKLGYLERLFTIFVASKNMANAERAIVEIAKQSATEDNNNTFQKIYRSISREPRVFRIFLKVAESYAQNKKDAQSARIYYDISTVAHHAFDSKLVIHCHEQLAKLNTDKVLSTFEKQQLQSQKYTVTLSRKMNVVNRKMQGIESRQTEILDTLRINTSGPEELSEALHMMSLNEEKKPLEYAYSQEDLWSWPLHLAIINNALPEMLSALQKAEERDLDVGMLLAAAAREFVGNSHNTAPHHFTETIRTIFSALQALSKRQFPSLQDYQLCKICLIATHALEAKTATYIAKHKEASTHNLLIDFQRKSFTILLTKEESTINQEGSAGKVRSGIEICTDIIPHVSVVAKKKSRHCKMPTEEIEYERRYGSLRSWTHVANKTVYTLEAYDCALDEDGAKQLSIQKKLYAVKDIAIIIQKMHNDNVIHWDIKTQNAMVQFLEGKTKGRLIDFGLCFEPLKDKSPYKMITMYGTPSLTAPEMLKDPYREYSLEERKAQDIYAFGCLLMEYLLGLKDYEEWYKEIADEAPNRMQTRVTEKQTVALEKAIHEMAVISEAIESMKTDVHSPKDQLTSTIYELLNPDPSKRKTIDLLVEEIDQLLEHADEL